jgi:cell volume regulation protein A
MPLAEILAATAILLILSIFASKASGRLGVPALLLFLGVGMLAGSEGVGGIYFDNVNAAEHLGIVALAFLLFAGGLETNWDFVRNSVCVRAACGCLTGFPRFWSSSRASTTRWQSFSRPHFSL